MKRARSGPRPFWENMPLKWREHWTKYGPGSGIRFLDDALVYFIQEPDQLCVKIGVAKNVSDRLRKLQSSHPRALKLLATCAGGLRLEMDLHIEFASDRLLGEWFTATPALYARIVELCGVESDVPEGSWRDHRCELCESPCVLPHGKKTHCNCGGRFRPDEPIYLDESLRLSA